MKILFVSAVLPFPLHSGGQIRIYNLLKRLSKKHDIHLYTFIRTEVEKKHIAELTFCKNVSTVLRGRAWQPKYIFGALTNSYPFLWNTYHNSTMLSLLSDEIARGGFDLVHIEPGYVWPSIPSSPNIPIVVAEHNVEHEVYQKYADAFPVSFIKPFLSFDVAKMQRWEKRIWKVASAVVAVSDDDRKKIGGNAHVVPNGVNIKTYTFNPKHATSGPLRFLYVGNFRWMENKDAADNILKNYWPVITSQYPDAELRIVGQHAPDGPVENLQEEFSKTDILLAPIRIGGGTKFKILEAMAAGVRVITTTLGAQGLDTSCLWIADKPEDMEIADVIKDTEKIRKARMLIETRYNWDTIAQTLDRIWNSLS